MTGGISMAFHIGQISALKTMVTEITRLAKSEASYGERVWASGYIDAGNQLMESINDTIKTLKKSFEGKTKLSDLAEAPAPVSSPCYEIDDDGWQCRRDKGHEGRHNSGRRSTWFHRHPQD